MKYFERMEKCESEMTCRKTFERIGYIILIYMIKCKMWVKITIKDTEWNAVWSFDAEDKKSFTQMAKSHDISIATSCNAGACGMCKCKIIKWHDYIQTDKIMKPMWELKYDDNGKLDMIFTCVAWVKTKYIDDDEIYEIVLKKNI